MAALNEVDQLISDMKRLAAESGKTEKSITSADNAITGKRGGIRPAAGLIATRGGGVATLGGGLNGMDQRAEKKVKKIVEDTLSSQAQQKAGRFAGVGGTLGFGAAVGAGYFAGAQWLANNTSVSISSIVKDYREKLRSELEQLNRETKNIAQTISGITPREVLNLRRRNEGSKDLKGAAQQALDIQNDAWRGALFGVQAEADARDARHAQRAREVLERVSDKVNAIMDANDSRRSVKDLISFGQLQEAQARINEAGGVIRREGIDVAVEDAGIMYMNAEAARVNSKNYARAQSEMPADRSGD